MQALVRSARVVLATAVVAAAGALGAHPAAADDAAAGVVIRKVDTTNAPNVQLTVLRPPASTSNSDIRLSENGKPVVTATVKSSSDVAMPMGVVLVIDTSVGTENGQLDKIKAAAIDMIGAKAPGEKFAIVATNGTARTVVSFTDQADILVGAVNKLTASNQNALWSGVKLAAGLLTEGTGLQANVVVVSATADELSPAGTLSAAADELKADKAVVFSVAVADRTQPDVGNLQALASVTGGRFLQTGDAGDVDAMLTGLQKNLASQAVIDYTSLGGDALDITVAVGSATAEAHIATGTVAEGSEVNPDKVVGAAGPSFLHGSTGLFLVAVVTLGCVGLLLYGLVEIVSKERNQLRRALRPYSDDPDEPRDITKLADSEIIKKAVAATAKAAQDRGLLEVVQHRLEQADLPLRPAEGLFFTALAALVAMLLGLAFFGPLGLGAAALLFLYLPIAITSFLANRRRKKFTAQLPDTLQLLAGSLRAGYSLIQGLDAVSKQCEAPMGTELQRAMAEARLGRPVEEALQEVSDRMGSDDFEWAIMAIKIQREVGGNLAELLMTVGETMIARERLRREVKALTAEGRVSAGVLLCLPPGIGAIISLLNPTYMSPMFSNPLGQYALIGAGVMMLLGYWLMRKMIEIEA